MKERLRIPMCWPQMRGRLAPPSPRRRRYFIILADASDERAATASAAAAAEAAAAGAAASGTRAVGCSGVGLCEGGSYARIPSDDVTKGLDGPATDMARDRRPLRCSANRGDARPASCRRGRLRLGLDAIYPRGAGIDVM